MSVNSAIDEIGVSAPWYSLAFFFSSPWFQRSWVVQECVASARSRNTPPMLYYGPRCISWDVLDDLIWGEPLCVEKLLELVAETWEMHPRRYPWNGDVFGFDFGNPGQRETCVVRHEIGMSFYTGLTEWLRLRTMMCTGTDTPGKDMRGNLVFWLTRIRARQATNPLDKIYSVLGLVQDLQGNGDSEDATLDALIVDYKASVEDVYSSLVRAIVVKTRNLRILAACTSRGHLIQRSWTPDWTQPRDYDLASYDLKFHGIYGTGFDASSGRECNELFADDLSTLSAEGIFWDTISFKTTTVALNDPTTSFTLTQGHLPEMIAGELLDIWKRSSRGSAYPDDDVCSLVLWRVLMARFSVYSNQPDLFENYHPTTTWVQQFHDALEASKGVGINIPSSMLGIFSGIGQTSLDPENIIRTLKLVIGNLMAWGGALLVTEKGYIGEATCTCQVDDIVCVLLGCNYPVILRPIGDHYEFVGTAYIPGIMNGEVIQAMEEGKVQSQVFELH
jgi:hypothetical protein